MNDVSDRELFNFVIEADEEAFNEGLAPNQRSFHVTSKVMKRLGYLSFVQSGVSTPPIVKRISALHNSLYRREDLSVGGLHGGIFMFRDVFVRIHIPIIYGRPQIDPFALTDLSKMQLKWLCSRVNDMQAFLDQFTDIFDFAGGINNLGDFKSPPENSLDTFRLAACQLQAAAATLSVAFDNRGAIQSALIGAELALKGGLAAIGVDEKARRKHGHNLASASNTFAKAKPDFDLPRVLKAIEPLPPYVENRYSSHQPGRVETGHIVMKVQYIAGEVMRQITQFSIRSVSTEPSERLYP
jgi:hypothetical protein